MQDVAKKPLDFPGAKTAYVRTSLPLKEVTVISGSLLTKGQPHWLNVLRTLSTQNHLYLKRCNIVAIGFISQMVRALVCITD